MRTAALLLVCCLGAWSAELTIDAKKHQLADGQKTLDLGKGVNTTDGVTAKLNINGKLREVEIFIGSEVSGIKGLCLALDQKTMHLILQSGYPTANEPLMDAIKALK